MPKALAESPDGVVIDDSDRPVPWKVLEKKATASELELWQQLFDDIEPDVN